MNKLPDYRAIALRTKNCIDTCGIIKGDNAEAILNEINAALKQEKEYIEFTRVNSDNNGNPRYVCHFLNFITDKDENSSYELALKRAKKIGGGKFHNKQYGGGIVFQSYNIDDTANAIRELMSQYK